MVIDEPSDPTSDNSSLPSPSEIEVGCQFDKNLCSENNIAVSESEFKDIGKTDSVVLFGPISKKGNQIEVYENCINGSCGCSHYLGGRLTQLKPCCFTALMFEGDRVCSDDELKLYSGIVDGFDIVESEVITGYDCENYKSVLEPKVKEKMDELIKEELTLGYKSVVEEKPVCIHALGVAPKPDGGVRPITDCSRPVGSCINEKMSNIIEKFSYKSVEDVIQMLNPHDFLSIVDIKSAYRTVAINPSHSTYQGLRWDLGDGPFYMVDHRLCFGLRCGPFYFSLISNFVQKILVETYDMRIVQYLDDFCVIGGSYGECMYFQQKIISTLRYLGFAISWSKVTSPATVVTYLGIIIDSDRMELRLPDIKLEKLRAVLSSVEGKRFISKKKLEQLTGLLAHCSCVIRGGKTYCRRLYDLLKVALHRKLNKVRLTDLGMTDISWWSKFAAWFNGISAIPRPDFIHKVYTDSSKRGFAALMGNDWILGTWIEKPETLGGLNEFCTHWVSSPNIDVYDESNINELEFWPVLQAIKHWLPQIHSSRVTCVTDNQQVLNMLRSGRSSNKTCMEWIKELFWVCALHAIEIKSVYIRSEENVWADHLSRLMYRKNANEMSNLVGQTQMCCKDRLLSCCRSVVGVDTEEKSRSSSPKGGAQYHESSKDTMELLP